MIETKSKKLDELQFELKYWEGKREEAQGGIGFAIANITLIKRQIKDMNSATSN